MSKAKDGKKIAEAGVLLIEKIPQFDMDIFKNLQAILC